jgi:SRSO17 transposase
LGNNANCQTLVSVTLASGELPLMLSLRLFLPESWMRDEARMIRAGVPEQFRQPRTKPEIAIEEIDRVAGAGVRFGCVLADAGYGLSASFRQALSARGLFWAVGIPRHQKVYPADVQLIFPVATHGRPRLRHVPDLKSAAAHSILEGAKWRQVSWRRGTKGRLVARLAAMRVRIADGAPQRIGSSRGQHMPGEEVWLVGEHRSNGERKYYLSNLPAGTPIKEVAGAIKARWICEQAHQQLKEELGLDHFEGRSWSGLHRHALMTMMAYAFLQARRLAQARRKKTSAGPPPQPSLPAVRQAILHHLPRSPPTYCARCKGHSRE